jgi:hemerythrin superfamily protein
MELTMATPSTGTAEDAIDVLRADHYAVKEQFSEFERLGTLAPLPTRIALAQDICIRLTIHSAIEEELFYPVVRNVIDDPELVNKAEIEHDTSGYLIEQLLPVGSDDAYFEAKVTVLREYTKHHIDEEENVIFPKVRQTYLDLVTLGRQLLDRKLALQSELATPEQLIAFMSSRPRLGSHGTGVGVSWARRTP